MPKITTIIPTYHRPDLLARAIKSVQLQEFEDWECIIFSDHCPKAGLVYENYFKNDSRIIFVENPNKWIKNVGAVGVNYGLENANSDIITYLCDDNIFLPNHFRVIYEEHQKGQFDYISTSGFHFHLGNGNFLIKEIINKGLENELNLLYYNRDEEAVNFITKYPDMLRIAHSIEKVVNKIGYWLPWEENPMGFKEDTEFMQRLGTAFKKIDLDDLTNVYYSRNACQTRDEDYHEKVVNLAKNEIFVYPEQVENDLSI
tara:strand:- start:1243 stop:2016 length:774 start_codon:yes stop_codon:yes gene_type:complete